MRGMQQGTGSDAKGHRDEVKITDVTPEFEEYTAPPRLDESGRPLPKARGLGSQGYQFPPPGGPPPPLTKANLAKGIGVPAIPRSSGTSTQAPWPVPPVPGAVPGAAGPRGAHAAATSASSARASHDVPGTLVRQLEPAPVARPTPPPVVKVDEGEQFEEYRRPDLDRNPATGKGIRSEPPPPPSAKEILQGFEPPVPEIVVPKRFGVMPVARRPEGQDETAAHLDALADLAAVAPNAVMSQSSANGPIKTVIHHDDDDREEMIGQIESKPTEADGASVPLSPPTAAASTIPYVPPTASPPPAGVSAVLASRAAMLDTPTVPIPSPPMTAASIADPVAMPIATGAHVDAPSVPAGGPVPRIGVVHCLYNRQITDAMVQAAQAEADRLGAPLAGGITVPGVFDAPLAAKRLLARDDVDAVVVIGCVIRGETGHDELITHAAAQTLLALACNADKPVGLGITGPRMTEKQAWARVQNAAHAVASVVAQHRALLEL